MKFKFKTQITEQDYIDFSYFSNLHTEFGKKQQKKINIATILALLVVAVAFVVLTNFNKIGIICCIAIVMAAVIVPFNSKFIAQFTNKYQIKIMKSSGKLPYDEEAEYEFYEDKFIEITNDSKMEVLYSKINSVYLVNATVMYIYTSSLNGMMIPLNSFNSNKEFADFIDFIASKHRINNISI